jgi:ribosome-associated protein YbcJ (S4-like RNA binding protein)
MTKRLRRPLPAYIDLIQWLKLRGHAQTTGEAKELLKAGAVRSGANPVGRIQVKVNRGNLDTVEYVPQPLVDAGLRKTLYVQRSDSVR